MSDLERFMHANAFARVAGKWGRGAEAALFDFKIKKIFDKLAELPPPQAVSTVDIVLGVTGIFAPFLGPLAGAAHAAVSLAAKFGQKVKTEAKQYPLNKVFYQNIRVELRAMEHKVARGMAEHARKVAKHVNRAGADSRDAALLEKILSSHGLHNYVVENTFAKQYVDRGSGLYLLKHDVIARDVKQRIERQYLKSGRGPVGPFMESVPTRDALGMG